MKRQQLHVLYVPGLGDTKRVRAQRLVVGLWRLWGVEPELVQMHWADDEPWSAKLARLLARIDEITADGAPVGLVGSSAGASAVMNAYARRSSTVVGCVLIAGKVLHANTIRDSYRRENPAFVVSAQACERALAQLPAEQRRRILSRYAAWDGIVPRQDSMVVGAHNRTMPTLGHAFTIGAQLTLGAPSLVGFLRRLSTHMS